jgi:uridine kinase
MQRGRDEAVSAVKRQRLLDALAGRLADLAAAEGGAPYLVAVDGVDGAGKTRFADELDAALRVRAAVTFRASVDGFHHPPHVRYRRGRTSPAGFYLDSFDLAAFRRLLLDPLRAAAIGAWCGPSTTWRASSRWHAGGGTRRRDHRHHRRDLPAPSRARGRWDLSIYLAVPFEVSVGAVRRQRRQRPGPRRPVQPPVRRGAASLPRGRAPGAASHDRDRPHGPRRPRIVADRPSAALTPALAGRARWTAVA